MITNTMPGAVLLTHLPTGRRVHCSKVRGRCVENKRAALRMLRAQLYAEAHVTPPAPRGFDYDQERAMAACGTGDFYDDLFLTRTET